MTKTRYIGGWSNNRCGDYLERCRQQPKASGALQPEAAVDEFQEEAFAAGPDVVCEHCGSERVELIEETPKPSWKELFWREDARCPRWYADRQQESHRRLWTGCYGEDFYDWYRATAVESAKEIGPGSSRPIQLPLPNFWADRPCRDSYLVDSF